MIHIPVQVARMIERAFTARAGHCQRRQSRNHCKGRCGKGASCADEHFRISSARSGLTWRTQCQPLQQRSGESLCPPQINEDGLPMAGTCCGAALGCSAGQGCRLVQFEQLGLRRAGNSRELLSINRIEYQHSRVNKHKTTPSPSCRSNRIHVQR